MKKYRVMASLDGPVDTEIDEIEMPDNATEDELADTAFEIAVDLLECYCEEVTEDD